MTANPVRKRTSNLGVALGLDLVENGDTVLDEFWENRKLQ